MAFDLAKKTILKEWYFNENDIQYGPFQLSELLDKINRDTLVWSEGMEWMKAEDVTDLQKYFPTAKSISSVPEQQEVESDFELKTNTFISPQKMFSSPFSFEGRIRRTEYGISLIIYVISHGVFVNLSESSSLFGFGFIPLYWFLWAQGAKRCHDRQNSGWYQIIPFYVFWMIFAEGDYTENEFGHSPK